MNHPESPVAVIGDEHKQAPEVGSNGLSQQLLAAEEKLSEAPQRSPSMVTRVKSSAGVKQSAPSSLYELTGNTGAQTASSSSSEYCFLVIRLDCKS